MPTSQFARDWPEMFDALTAFARVNREKPRVQEEASAQLVMQLSLAVYAKLPVAPARPSSNPTGGEDEAQRRHAWRTFLEVHRMIALQMGEAIADADREAAVTAF